MCVVYTPLESVCLHFLQGKDLGSFLVEITSIIMAKKDAEVRASARARMLVQKAVRVGWQMGRCART